MKDSYSRVKKDSPVAPSDESKRRIHLEEFRRFVDRVARETADSQVTDSTDLIREDRDSR